MGNPTQTKPEKPVKPTKPPVPQTLARNEPKQKQALKDQINKKAKPYTNVDTSVKFRYVCPACTGVAFKSREIELGQTNKMCASCFKRIGYLVRENYINL